MACHVMALLPVVSVGIAKATSAASYSLKEKIIPAYTGHIWAVLLSVTMPLHSQM